MKHWILFFVGTFCLLGCRTSDSQQAVVTTEQDFIDLPAVEALPTLDSTFFTQHQKEVWPEYIELHSSFNNLSQLRPEGLDVFLTDLEKQSLDLLKKSFPEAYEKPPIRGRIKVMHTMIMQARYAAFRNDSLLLDQSLKQLKDAIQAVNSRLLSLETVSPTWELSPADIDPEPNR
ncbi:MAG: hypothetical protein ACON42_06310 [Flavobacteriaceae bacterium]